MSFSVSATHHAILSNGYATVWYARPNELSTLGAVHVKSSNVSFRRVFGIASALMLGVAIGGLISMFIIAMFLL
jgi:hypothetical protein